MNDTRAHQAIADALNLDMDRPIHAHVRRCLLLAGACRVLETQGAGGRMKKVSDTPRTAALEAEMQKLSYSAPNNYCLELCQQLERELNSALVCAGVASKERGEWAVEREYTKADCEAMCEIAVAAVREPLMSDRKRLVGALRSIIDGRNPIFAAQREITLSELRALLRELGESE